MPTQTTDLFLLADLEDLEDVGELGESDRDPLRAVADWIKTFVVRPHEDLGRAARRFGESAVLALAEELRGLPWRAEGAR
jgi:hypothetical protein